MAAPHQNNCEHCRIAMKLADMFEAGAYLNLTLEKVDPRSGYAELLKSRAGEIILQRGMARGTMLTSQN